MKIFTAAPEGTTVIQNTFIDQYMPHANGEFVKVYLYLLRCANTGRELSLSSIADVFDHTEKDVQRALTYWERQKVISLAYASDGSIRSVTFQDAALSEASNCETESDYFSIEESAVIPEKPSTEVPSKARVAQVSEQQEMRQLIYVAEQYLQRPLNSSEQTDLIYYYDTLHFSTDLIEYLLEYCISKGSFSRHYMKKVALAWAEAGITTVLQAKQETNLFNKNFYTVMNAFGIRGRAPAKPEQEIMSHWFDELGFSTDLILEACRRTILQTHQPNFQYAGKILEHWFENKVSSLKDIAALDAKRKKENKKPAPQNASPNSGKSFQNFEQRDYDYEQIEKKLLASKKED